MNVLDKYFEHLAQNPERIDNMLIFFVCTLFCWFWLIKYRERIILGLEGGNKLWESGEQVIWLMQMIVPPVIFYFLCFVPDSRIYILVLIAGIVLYAVGGRWLLEYGLVLKSGGSIKDLKEADTEPPKQ